MNTAVNALYAKYLDHTGGDKAAAASLTLADTLQRTLDAKAEPVAEPTTDGLLNIPQAAGYLGCTPDGLRKIVARTQASQTGQRVNGPTIEFFQSRKHGPIRFGGGATPSSKNTTSAKGHRRHPSSVAGEMP